MPTTKRTRTIVKDPPKRIKTLVLRKVTSQKTNNTKRPIIVGLSLEKNGKHQKNPLSTKATAMISRTGLKQELMREQVENEKKREAKTDILAQSILSISLPTSAVSVPQRTSNVSVGVPKQVLKVQTKLENPTRYHVQENQKRQISQYLTDIQGVSTISSQILANSDSQSQHRIVNSCDPSPVSSYSYDPCSSATTSEWMWDGLTNMEGEFETELNCLQLESGTVPLPAVLPEIFGLSEPYTKGTTSCNSDRHEVKEEPFTFLESELRTVDKDRIKKDNHNKIERRRRFNINDRIKDLGKLLPGTCEPHYELVRDQRQNKGTILRATVKYVQELKKDLQTKHGIEEQNRHLEQQNKKLLLRIQELEIELQNHGIPLTNSVWQPSSAADLNAIMQEPSSILSTETYSVITKHLVDTKLDCPSPSPSSGLSSAPSASPAAPCNGLLDEYLMDDDINDPLLSSQSLRKDVCFAETVGLISIT